jgi:uncharacterized protein (DUF362 family)
MNNFVPDFKSGGGMTIKHSFSRRDFLKMTGAMAAAGVLPGCVGLNPRSAGQAPSDLIRLPGYQPCLASFWAPREGQADFYAMFKKTVEAVTDFSWLHAGDRVLVKLALNSGKPFPATSDPWSLYCTVKLLYEKGAGEVLVGDQSGVEAVHWTAAKKRGASRDCCRSAGLLKVIEELDARPVFFEERGYEAYRETRPEGLSHWGEPLYVSDVLEQVDHLVYLPRVGSHILGDITSGMKLGIGFLREDSRLKFHQGGSHFYAMYEEVNHVPEIREKLRLLISSGRSVLANFGPDAGYIATPDRGLVFASSDILAHEVFASAWLKWNRRQAIPFYSDATTGTLTRFRSMINKGFVRWIWHRHYPLQSTPSLPFYQAGNIYGHPSVRNALQRSGGMPEDIYWEDMNAGQGDATASVFIRECLKSG